MIRIYFVVLCSPKGSRQTAKPMEYSNGFGAFADVIRNVVLTKKVWERIQKYSQFKTASNSL